MPADETVTLIIELPADEAELITGHATETDSPVSWWIRAACLVAGLYSPLPAIPADLRDALPSDDDEPS